MIKKLKALFTFKNYYRQYKLEHEGVQLMESKKGYVVYKFDYENKTACVLEVYVNPRYRAQGHAQFLMGSVRQRAERAGLQRMITTVDPSDSGAPITHRMLIQTGMRKMPEPITVPLDFYLQEIS